MYISVRTRLVVVVLLLPASNSAQVHIYIYYFVYSWNALINAWTWMSHRVVHSTIGQFSETGLHEWRPFVIFCTISSERLKPPLLGWFPSRRCFMLCVTMEVELRTAKQYRCRYCCVCKNYGGEVMEDGKKCLCNIFWLTRRLRVSGGKMHFWGIQ